jgi:hypothetical protein
MTAEPGGWLAEQIPPMPSLHGGARAGEDAEAPGLPLVDGAT